MAVSRGYWASLPEEVRAHLHCAGVEELTPIVQNHMIEGLVMGDAWPWDFNVWGEYRYTMDEVGFFAHEHGWVRAAGGSA